MSNKLFKYFVTAAIMIFMVNSASAQDDHEMSQEEYELTYDNYAVAAIKLMVKYGEVNDDVETLKQILASKDEQIEKKQEELYALVGATQSSVNDFRRKFEETEKRINNRTGTPSDARSMYYDEIFSSKIKCLPEFSERFQSMRHRMEDWEGTKTTVPIVTQETPPPVEGTYLVVKGDCLWRISSMKYGSPYYWPAIWEANKNGVVNKDGLLDFRHQAITNPDLIYPGQVLKIPSVNTDPGTKREEYQEKFKKFRKERLINR